MALSSALAGHAQSPCNCKAEGEADGFRVLTIITGDEDWREQWDTPPDVFPNFKTTSRLSSGDTATLLIFFSNAQTENSRAKISCDLHLARPDGTELNHGPALCGEGKIEGPPENLRLTGLEVNFEIDDDDPVGVWQFDIGVSDDLRGVRVPLSISVEVVAGE